MTRQLFFAAALGLVAAPASAQSLPAAIASGAVGERFDGYVGLAAEATPELRREVKAVNIKRRNLYIQLASSRNATAELVGMTTACELFEKLDVGQSYLLADGVWRRLLPGQARPQPDYCR